MTYLVGTLLIITFVYAFQGLLSFLPWTFGFLRTVVYFPIEIVNQVVYPVGNVVYAFYTGLVFFLLFRFIINLYHTHI